MFNIILFFHCGNDGVFEDIPANMTHRRNVRPMLDHRLRRRPNIGPTLCRCVMFAGISHNYQLSIPT